MRKRSMTALAVATVMGMTACGGGGGSKSLSEDDFVDALADLCADIDRDLGRIDAPVDTASTEDFAADSTGVFTDLQEGLAEIVPPEDFERDYGRFQGAVDDVLEQLAELEEAAKDEDDDKMADIFGNLEALSERTAGFAEDLDVEECRFGAADTTPDTAAETTIPATTTPSLTLPPTLPPATAPPATDPPATDPPVDIGPLFNIVDLSTVFNAPLGFEIVDTGQDAAQPFIDTVADVAILNIGIDEMGVGAISDEFGSVATLVVGTALEGFGMPEEWKTLLCDPSISEIQTTSGGITGVFCFGIEGTGIFEIFTITDGDLGVTIATVDPTFAVADLVDGFFAANL